MTFFLLSLLANSLVFVTLSQVRCPDGFTILNDSKCVKIIENSLLLNNALESCRTYTDGTLVSIHNAIDNRALINLAVAQQTVRPIWIGLTCLTPSCVWLDQSQTDYTNFVSNPQPDVGINVYMLTSGNSAGKWVSADGSLVSLNYICEVPAIIVPDLCSNPFNDYCYTFNQDVRNEINARIYCQKDCGDLVSIHSEKENRHVLSLFNFTSPPPQVRIGAGTDGIGKYWVDGTVFDYSNFGYFNVDIGKCSTMQIPYGVLDAGQWLSNNCDDELPFVCKRLNGITSCPPSPTPTYNPNMCYGSHFFTGNGTIYSPNYPESYYGQFYPCTFIFTVPSGNIAQVMFTLLNIDDQSKISLYSGIEGTEPIIELTGQFFSPPPFNSSTNVMKMIFDNGERVYNADTKWIANYGYNLSL
ncbi:hypothetical protein GCK72_019864 [Caenorhabditis remanei]|uniref:C-type lectin domain-containing protein n=1 Tax=Caenorhabditis remanei TaxID=31234 RepID=A0A6A5GDU9_CAERE|nr:hypothetical protein GCK72_019864 [Caenorhabditis remanei]KAF1753308.1 hypothetical protein GCK72_019864 [Caenorhabditis remanei]